MDAAVTRTWPGGILIRVSGELDLATAGTLRSLLSGHAERGVKEIVLDLGDLHFCDASGLSALIATQNQVLTRGGSLRLAGVQPHMARLLRAAHLDQTLHASFRY